jgi:hypothetical protein
VVASYSRGLVTSKKNDALKAAVLNSYFFDGIHQSDTTETSKLVLAAGWDCSRAAWISAQEIPKTRRVSND